MESLAVTEKRFPNKLILFIAQGAYAGRFPVAPGTAGTLIGIPVYLLLAGLPSGWYVCACILMAVLAVWSAGEAEKILGKTDDGSIVIDEIAGYLISLMFLPSGWGFIIGAFFLFRLFDVLKPVPLKRLQDLHGGPGVVLDDIGAGVYTNLVLQAAVLVANNY